MHRFKRSADERCIRLLLSRISEGQAAVRQFVGELQAWYQHDRNEAECEDDDHHPETPAGQTGK
jgi:hypothetical protein